ncbi:MAG: NAD-dependent epimerase/dehydratase family protein [Candidatus Woesearchaeota archaeon]
MNALVTGATGFIGKNLVRRLVREGIHTTSLVRKTSKDVLILSGSKIAYADLLEKRTLKKPLEGIDTVFHLAGTIGKHSATKEFYYKANVLATKNLVEMCRRKKIIYCSSAGVIGPATNADENYPPRPTNEYEKSKKEAEQIVRQHKDYVILRPEFVYGPYDMHVLQLFKAIRDNRFFLIGGGNSLLHPTYVEDVVQAMLKCVRKKRETYNIAGQKSVTVAEFTELAKKELGVKTKTRNLPLWLARALLPIGELTGTLTRTRLDFFTKTRTFDISKARKELGYKPVKLRQGLKRTIGWYRQNGLL